MKLNIKKILKNDNGFKISNSFHKAVSISKFNKKKKKSNPKTWVKIFYKTYPRLNSVALPKPLVMKSVNIFDLLTSRRSQRKFSKQKISLTKISYLLFYSSGIIKIKNKNFDTALRSYPSAGARFPLELYIVVNRVEKIKKGIYHYNVKEHTLEMLRTGDFSKIMQKITSQKFTRQSGVNIIFSAVFDRTRIKYGDRGYRFPFIESGHLAQNSYLISEALDLNCCAIGGFIDNEINNLLDFADTSEKVIYMLSIGSKP